MTQRHAKLEAQGFFEHQEALTAAYQARLKEAARPNSGIWRPCSGGSSVENEFNVAVEFFDLAVAITGTQVTSAFWGMPEKHLVFSKLP
jgi:hypothetical protein